MATITWFVPSLLEGSGGHRTIFQHIHTLQEHGHSCTVHLEPGGLRDPEEARQRILTLFDLRITGPIHFGFEAKDPCDLAVATVWFSARVVRDLPFPCRKAYFVQDNEALFNPMGDGFLMAENSYRYGLAPITIGRWLTAMLNQRYQVAGRFFDFCADKSIYRPLPGVRREDPSVVFIHQPDKPRRCSRIGIEALGIVKHVMPEVSIHLYGSREKGHVWFPHVDHGLMGIAACNELYNRSSLGLCLSSSNPSRIPFEMMAAGLPVVELHRENTLYDLPDAAVELCDQSPESLAKGMLALLRNAERCKAMGEAGLNHMRHRDLEFGFRQFREAIDELLTGDGRFLPQTPPTVAFNRPPIVEDAYAQTLVPGAAAHLVPANPRSGPKQVLKRLVRPIARQIKTWLDT